MTIPPGTLPASPDFSHAFDLLASADADLARWQRRYGTPRPWARQPGFDTLVRILIEQQVSLASARAVYERLRRHAGELTPRRVLALSDGVLRDIGLSRQKRGYIRDAAVACEAAALDLADLPANDELARARLREVRGIGPWTAEVYLLMADGRLDAWPSSDLGILEALRELKGLEARPCPAEAERLAAPWRPYRGAAAWLLWHGYLRSRGLPLP